MNNEGDAIFNEYLKYRCLSGMSPVSEGYWGYLNSDFNFNELPKDYEDVLMRNFLAYGAVKLTPEQIEQTKQEAPWIEITDDGLKLSKGMVELLQEIGKSIFEVE